ncbi:MAG: hypothetical protein SGILL_005802, partial [Bacillariaceae sp.]
MSFWDAVNRLDAADQRLADMGEGTISAGLDITRQAQQAQLRGPPKVLSSQLVPPFLSCRGFVFLHEATVKQDSMRAKKNENKFYSRRTMRPHITHGAAPPIRTLTPITLREVATKVNHIHDDRILWVKTIYDSHKMIGTNVLVEDEMGDCLMLTLYNFVPERDDPNDYFPNGTYMAILAPYMKHSCDDPTKTLFLRCDNPECIRIFETHRSWIAGKRGKKLIDAGGLDPGLLRKEGNDAFADGRWEKAARLYTRSLACPTISPQDKLSCYSNLAETRIRQEQWEAAEECANLALALDPAHKKSLYRLSTALMWLNKTQEAKEVVTMIAVRDDKEFKKLVPMLDRLAKENQHGEYDFAKMYEEARRWPGQALRTFHSNYVSPDIESGVEIAKREGSFTYRGTIAVESLSEGTLVSSSKALAFCARGESNEFALSIDPYNKSMTRGSTMGLESELICMMHRRPVTRAVVYSLASTTLAGEDDSSSNKIDSKRVHDIVVTNTFGVSNEEEAESAWEKFKGFQVFAEAKRKSAMETGSGLWLNESLFNHSCTPNCTWKPIGDQMFVWTTRVVQPGEELCISYTDLKETSFSERKETFANWIQPGVGFSCQCDSCHVIRDNQKLELLDAQVHQAYEKAASMVSLHRMKMAVAAEQVMSRTECQEHLQFLSDKFPDAVQHNAAAKLWILEGSCLGHKNDAHGALQAYERAAEIKYAIRGSNHRLDRAKDLWRVVGASMACDYPTKAQEVLNSVYREVFSIIHSPDRDAMFRDLTLESSMPWWSDSYSYERQQTMEVLIGRTIEACNRGSKANRSSKKKSLRKNKKS